MTEICKHCKHWTPLFDDGTQEYIWQNVGYWGVCSVHHNECYNWDSCDQWEREEDD